MPVIDLIGQKFNHWLVIERAPNNKSGDAMWLCECDCEAHTRKIVKGSSLRSGHSKSCGCLKKKTAAETGRKNTKDLVGQTFGLLTVLEKGPSKNHKVHWKCECSCNEHNILYVSTDKLLNGHTRSCGCLTKNNLLNKTFGKLTVIEETNQRASDGCIIWRCRCSCPAHTIVEVASTKLIQGLVGHCGCEGQASAGETRIIALLDNNQITYQREKTFTNCRYLNGTFPRFDFFVDNKYLIEFDGEQHFHARTTGWFTQDKYEQIQQHDQFKTSWCKENNIPLIRIPYTRLSLLTIEDLKLETSPFLLH